ncbi:Protein of unknown function, partial [Cotesia congregata]
MPKNETYNDKNLQPIGSGPCYQSIGPGSNPAYTNEYFQYLSVLFCSAQEIQTSSNLKSLPPTVVAHDLSSLCDFKQIKKKKKKNFKNLQKQNVRLRSLNPFPQ